MDNRAFTEKIRIVWIIVTVIFIFGALGGDAFGWENNYACYPILGCNGGFGGLDALVHFLGGISIMLGIVWLFRRFPRLSLFNDSFWKNALILAGMAALICMCWEIMEYHFDLVRMTVFHMNLTNPNHLAQPSNADTMGDMTWGLIGALVTICVLRIGRILE